MWTVGTCDGTRSDQERGKERTRLHRPYLPPLCRPFFSFPIHVPFPTFTGKQTTRVSLAHPAGAHGLGSADVLGPPDGLDAGAGAGLFDPAEPALSAIPSLACIMGSCTSCVYLFWSAGGARMEDRGKEFNSQGGIMEEGRINRVMTREKTKRIMFVDKRVFRA